MAVLVIPYPDFVPGTTIVSAEIDANYAAIKAWADATPDFAAHAAATNAHSATASATALRIMLRDALGRTKAAAPSAADDIAILSTVTDHAAVTNSHGATASPTANKIPLRDAAGRTQFADPAAAQDAGTKNYVDTKTRTRPIILTAPAADLSTTNPAVRTAVEGTNHPYTVLAFNKDTDQSAFWHFAVPTDYVAGNITVTFCWIAPAATTNAVVWTFSTLGIDEGEAWDAAMGAAQSVTDTTNAVAKKINECSPAAFDPGWAAGDEVAVKVTRNADDAADTLAEDAHLLMVKIEFTGGC